MSYVRNGQAGSAHFRSRVTRGTFASSFSRISVSDRARNRSVVASGVNCTLLGSLKIAAASARQEVPLALSVMATLACYLILLLLLATMLQRWLLKGRSFITVSGKGFRTRPVILDRSRYLAAGLGRRCRSTSPIRTSIQRKMRVNLDFHTSPARLSHTALYTRQIEAIGWRLAEFTADSLPERVGSEIQRSLTL